MEKKDKRSMSQKEAFIFLAMGLIIGMVLGFVIAMEYEWFKSLN